MPESNRFENYEKFQSNMARHREAIVELVKTFGQCVEGGVTMRDVFTAESAAETFAMSVLILHIEDTLKNTGNEREKLVEIFGNGFMLGVFLSECGHVALLTREPKKKEKL